MKKMRKIISLIVALAFLFSIAVPAMAAEPTAAEKAGNKLLSLGVIEGYPGGGLGLDKTITRAEITVILAKSTGMKDAAELLKSTPSKFSDVKPGEWYTGWINLAAAQGWVKGDPQGTFRPNDPVSYREIVTMLMKILGYNDNLPGDWPVDYLVKAAALEITKDVAFDAKAPAVRGDVFQFASKTLETKIVSYDKDNDKFNESADTLLSKYFDSGTVVDKVVVKSVTKVNGKIKLNGIEMTADAKIVGAADAAGLQDKYVKYILTDGKISYVEVKDGSSVVEGVYVSTVNSIAENASIKIKVGSDEKTYKFGKDAVASIVYKDEVVDFSKEGVAAADVIKLTLDKDGKVVGLRAIDVDTLANMKDAIVKSVDAAKLKITAKRGDDWNLDEDADDYNYVVVKDGKFVDFSDIKENDIVYDFGSVYDVDNYFVVIGKKVEGTFESVSKFSGTDVTQIKVDGKKYDFSGVWSTDNGDDFNATTMQLSDAKDFIGKNVVLGFGINPNSPVYLAGDIDTSEDSYKYALLIKRLPDVPSSTGTNDYLRFLLADGTKVSYLVTDDSADLAQTAVTSDVYDYALVKFTLDSDGAIDKFEVVSLASAMTLDITDVKDNTRVYYNSSWLTANNNTVVFRVYNDDLEEKAVTSSFSSLYSYIDDGQTLVDTYAYVKDGVVKYIVVKDRTALASSTMYAIYTGSGYNKDGYTITLNVKGESKTYNVKADADPGLTKYRLVSYTLVDGKTANEAVYSVFSPTKAVTKINSSANMVEIDNVWYTINSDSVIYDVTDDEVNVIGLSGKVGS